MQKIEIDVSNISEEDLEEVEAIILGALYGLGHYNNVVLTVTDDEEVVEAVSPGGKTPSE